MCIYVQSPLTESIPYIVHPTPKGSVALDSQIWLEQWLCSVYTFPSERGSITVRQALTIPNGEYMINGPHPSDIITGYEGHPTATYMDQVFFCWIEHKWLVKKLRRRN